MSFDFFRISYDRNRILEIYDVFDSFDCFRSDFWDILNQPIIFADFRLNEWFEKSQRIYFDPHKYKKFQLKTPNPSQKARNQHTKQM